MLIRLSNLALCAVTVSLLAACGGGDDDPQPSSATALITVTSASLSGQNGVYGSTSDGLSEVDKVLDGTNLTCVFSFNDLSRAGSAPGTLSGKVSYRENANTLSRLEVSVNGAVYASAAVEDSRVDRGSDRILFGDKVLVSTATGDTSTLVVNGAVPMRGSRPSGC